jgi:hypothetical protein
VGDNAEIAYMFHSCNYINSAKLAIFDYFCKPRQDKVKKSRYLIAATGFPSN